jgi:hypothetical protein
MLDGVIAGTNSRKVHRDARHMQKARHAQKENWRNARRARELLK